MKKTRKSNRHTNTKQAFQTELKTNLERCGLSMREFAELAGVSHGNLCCWAYGKRPIGEKTAQRLADTIARHSTFTRKNRESFLAAAALTETRPLYDASQALARYLMDRLDRHLKADGLAVSGVVERGDEIVLTLNTGRKMCVRLLDDLQTLPTSKNYQMEVQMRFYRAKRQLDIG